MGLTSDDLRALLAAFESGTWQEMTVCDGSDRLHVSRRSGDLVDRVNPELASAATTVPVAAPSIGIFRRTASPGGSVGAEDTIGMVDVAGVLRPVPAGVVGTIDRVLVDDGAVVEYGDPVALIRPTNG
jgi:biotin carboxyl carrier protein